MLFSKIDSVIPLNEDQGAVSLLYYKPFNYCLCVETIEDASNQKIKTYAIVPMINLKWGSRHSKKSFEMIELDYENRLRAKLGALGIVVRVSSTWRTSNRILTKINNAEHLINFSQMFSSFSYVPHDFLYCKNLLARLDITAYRLG